MRLIELSANQVSFHTVNFNHSGLTIIVAEKSDIKGKGGNKTYNSVGKSLIIALVNFCLGSKNNDDFKTKLQNWEFRLKFSINGEVFTAIRNTKNQKTVLLNDKAFSLENYKTFLESKLFPNIQEVKFLTWRSLISRFLRKGKDSYSEFDTYVQKEIPFAQLLNNAYLLGLDIDLITQKYDFKKSLDDTDKFRKSLEKDPTFKSYFIDQDKDIDIEISELEEQYSYLQKQIDEFQVAENYDKLKLQADQISDSRRELSNKINICRRVINNIDKSLSLQTDISTERIKDLYEQVNIRLPDNVVRSLNELSEFHKKITVQRTQRLKKEKEKFNGKMKALEDERLFSSKELDRYISYLENHGAIEELLSLNKQLSHINSCREKLKSFKDILIEYTKKIEEIKGFLSDSNIDAENYLQKNEQLVKNLNSTFKTIVKSFYRDKPSVMKISSNNKENQIRYNIDAKIQDDGGDGVNEVKIFSYDFTMLSIAYHKSIKFLFHDSRIFSDMDTRQQATIFRVAKHLSKRYNTQYIISINQNVINSIENEIETEEFESIFNNESIKLRLTDESDETKLLGMQVDIKYE